MKKVLSLALVLAASPAFGWANHDVLTRTALAPLGLENETVPVTALTDLVKALGLADARALNEKLQIKREYDWAFKAGEKVGGNAGAVATVALYSDEPDWGMDIELFEPAQYPELWKPEFDFVGGAKGPSSQAFRHLFFPSFSPCHPLKTLKLPLGKTFESLGDAPNRVQTYLNLSHEARRAGHKYWSVRFLANALHYLEDLNSPFHTSQTPTKLFVTLPFRAEGGQGTTQFTAQMTNVVTYYHFAFEEYIGRLVAESRTGNPSAPAKELLKALGEAHAYRDLNYRAGQGTAHAKAMVKYSQKLSAQAARASLAFFPALKGSLVTFNVTTYLSPAWWAEVNQAGTADTKARRKYFEVVRQMFLPLGQAVRTFAGTELRQTLR